MKMLLRDQEKSDGKTNIAFGTKIGLIIWR